MYKNAPSTSKYLTRSKKPTMIGLIMMNETICAPLTEKLPELLKTGKCSASRLNNGKMNRKHLNSLLFFSGVHVAFLCSDL